jgi:YD repeat-containing protein
MSGTTGSTENISTTSNQLKATSGGYVRTYAYDAAGNTLSYASNTYTFNQRGRMSSAVVSGAETDYVYNTLGQLIEKSGNGGTTLLVYDEAGHVLGEYTGTGALIQETVWMGIPRWRRCGRANSTSSNCCRLGRAQKSNFWNPKSALAVLEKTGFVRYLNDLENQCLTPAGSKSLGK